MRLTPFSISLTFAVSALALAGAATAQTGPGGYPARPIKMVVPAAQGSLTDPVARVIADAMKQRTGQPWIVENRPGAGGIIGSEAVARSEPDGYTLLFTANNFLISPAMYKNVPYKVRESFVPVAMIARADNLLVSNAGAGYKTLADLVAAAKKSPNGIDYTSPLIGSAAHLTVELFKREAGIPLNHVPYKDSSQGMNDTLAGRIPVNIMGKSTAIQHINTKTLIPLAYTGGKRAPELPDVPTFAEAGYPGVHLGLWFALFGPAKMPAAQAEYLSRQIAEALKSPEVMKGFANLGVDPLDGSIKTLADAVEKEEPIYRKVVTDAGISAD